jgi:hypothetical protein
MATKYNLNKLLSNYANEERKAKAAWRKAIMKLHPNKGGNTAYFQEMSHLFNKYYKGNNAARIPNTARRPSPPRRTSTWTPPPPPTRANVNNALLKLKSSVIVKGIRYKIYRWPSVSVSSIHRAKITIRRIIPHINGNAYLFQHPTRKRVDMKNRNMVNRAINAYFSKHH